MNAANETSACCESDGWENIVSAYRSTSHWKLSLESFADSRQALGNLDDLVHLSPGREQGRLLHT